MVRESLAAMTFNMTVQKIVIFVQMAKSLNAKLVSRLIVTNMCIEQAKRIAGYVRYEQVVIAARTASGYIVMRIKM